MTKEQLLSRLRRDVVAHGSQQDAAKELGVSEQYLSDVLRRRREPGAAILSAMGFQRVTTYQPISK